ncbi:hypothetical protein GCM10009547_47240 [Sporichthya brevicatena]|uniref:Cupin type-2 domain-containing protein n=1 Tax=Sporichthya brevicatena TaxID=171442 RepID=A0ABN1HBX2_9ACTN
MAPAVAVPPADPLAGPTPPPVVVRYRDPAGRTTLTLRAPVWHEGAWCTCFDRTFVAGAGRLPPHRHDSATETFFVRAGRVRYLRGGRLLTAGPGDVVTVDPGTVHIDPWATREGPAELTVLLRPADPTWLDFGLRLGAAICAGKLNRHGQMPLLALMDAVHRSGADVAAAGLPGGLQRRVSTPLLSRLHRVLGGGS